MSSILNMKTILFLITPLALACSLHADTLAGDKVTVKGSIIQETGTNGQTVSTPINPLTVLTALGVTNPPAAKDLSFYVDSTSESIVVAQKGIVAGGTASPLGTLYAIGTANVQWFASSKLGYNGGDNILMNGDLTGSHWLEGKISSKHVETDTRQFIGYGAISGTNTVVQGTIVDTFTAP